MHRQMVGTSGGRAQTEEEEGIAGAGGIAWSSGGWVTLPTLGGTLGSSLCRLEMQDVLGEGARVLRASTSVGKLSFLMDN